MSFEGILFRNYVEAEMIKEARISGIDYYERHEEVQKYSREIFLEGFVEGYIEGYKETMVKAAKGLIKYFDEWQLTNEKCADVLEITVEDFEKLRQIEAGQSE